MVTREQILNELGYYNRSNSHWHCANIKETHL